MTSVRGEIAFALFLGGPLLLPWLAVGGCSSEAPARPAELGNCIAQKEVSCGGPSLGGGGGSPPGDGGTVTNAGDGMAANDAGCMSLPVTSNATCQACIQQTCCDTCTTDPICVNLITCAMTCMAGDTSCLMNTCENLYPMAVAEYDNFATCIAGNCTPQCPALP